VYRDFPAEVVTEAIDDRDKLLLDTWARNIRLANPRHLYSQPIAHSLDSSVQRIHDRTLKWISAPEHRITIIFSSKAS